MWAPGQTYADVHTAPPGVKAREHHFPGVGVMPNAKGSGRMFLTLKPTSSLRGNNMIVPWAMLGDCHCFGKPVGAQQPHNTSFSKRI